MGHSNDAASAQLRAYFAERLARYGDDPRGVDWQSESAQHARFAAVIPGDLMSAATLLDAGCGLGHLYRYLCARDLNVRYTGCDLSAPHVEMARRTYPAARFVADDVGVLLAAERFDYVIACGLLHLRVPRWNRWAWTLVRALYRGARQECVFTLPRRGCGHPSILATVDPADWMVRLRQLCPQTSVAYLDPWGDAVFRLRRHVDEAEPG